MKKQIYIGLILFTLINLVQACFTPITEDEAYYWVWSQNLDWGYFDHPPMVAWWGAVGDGLFRNELGFRLLTVLMNGFSMLILYFILQPRSNYQRNLFYLLMGSVLVFSMFSWITTPDAPLLFFTILYLFSLKKFLENQSISSMLFLAIAFAGLMYSKYHGILVIVFTLLPAVRQLWKSFKFYMAILLSLLLYAPHLIWLYQHEFIPFQYHLSERSADQVFQWDQLISYFIIFFLGTAPLLSYFIVKAVIQFKPSTQFYRSIHYLAILPVLFFFVILFKDKVQPQWLLISFVGMTILTYEFYKDKQPNLWFYRLGWTGVWLVLVLRFALVLPSISPFEKNRAFAEHLKSFDVDWVLFEKYQEASLFLFYQSDKKATTHRTLGNRRSQFSFWNWEDEFQHKKVQFVSPWVYSDLSFVGGHKNYEYFIKEIPDYLTYHLLEIEAIDVIETEQNERIDLDIIIYNGHQHAVSFGDETLLKLNATYYQNKQYDVLYSQEIPLDKTVLAAGETIALRVSFRNIDQKGLFKLCFGIHYAPIGTTYLSSPIALTSR